MMIFVQMQQNLGIKQRKCTKKNKTKRQPMP